MIYWWPEKEGREGREKWGSKDHGKFATDDKVSGWETGEGRKEGRKEEGRKQGEGKERRRGRQGEIECEEQRT